MLILQKVDHHFLTFLSIKAHSTLEAYRLILAVIKWQVARQTPRDELNYGSIVNIWVRGGTGRALRGLSENAIVNVDGAYKKKVKKINKNS